ncbi:methylenetetrahydrofolate reductase (NADPH) [Rhizobium petrolearium]|uniref:methylenetetrahydrofolate reductase [NAD(P)H] n=1 Tax=Neorhizobium petrolearium TaxID=515361 RepID=UPI001AE57010|nr:methylenetetrahydrofolate reductase [NAD(P)H] [Neorhizobium petrolearium]MBP1844949.1 methylenetetrahydrofolate reductase (NADPH) [Neorhizobium petrolearium]
MTAHRESFSVSFEFFPPKSDEMEIQLWETVEQLSGWDPDFVSVTYGAGGSTKEPTLAAVTRMIGEEKLPTAAHLTCVDASREEIRSVIEDYRAAGVRRIVALRGDPTSGIGTAYVPHPEGFAETADLVRALVEYGDFDVSVSAYPEKHPESADLAADIDTLKRKADAGAARALSQFFFDNDIFERYLEKVRAAGIGIPVVPGIMPIQNLTQLKRFARRCGSSVPAFLDARFEGLDEKPEEREKVAADIAAEQMEDLGRRGIRDFHIYTMNRAPLVSAVLQRLGRRQISSPRIAAA